MSDVLALQRLPREVSEAVDCDTGSFPTDTSKRHDMAPDSENAGTGCPPPQIGRS